VGTRGCMGARGFTDRCHPQVTLNVHHCKLHHYRTQMGPVMHVVQVEAAHKEAST
jgi:hypothetical protein